MRATGREPASQLRGYGHPSEPLDEVLLLVTVEEYGRSITQFFIDQHGEQIAQSSEGLLESVQPWLDGAAPDGAAWDPAFGDLYRALVVGADGERRRILASVALHLACRGLPVSFAADLETPSRLRWGYLLLPEAEHLRVHSDGVRVVVVASVGAATQTVEMTRERGEWRSDGVEELMRLDCHGVGITLFTQAQLNAKEFDELRTRAVDTIDPRIISVFEQAIEIIRTCAPVYLPWIQRPLHHLFLLRPMPNNIESGSVEHYLGVIHLSAHAEPLPVAELFVHEASHQYMNVAKKVEPLDDGSDTTLYWSPPVQCERPLGLILAAYHAFGNVLEFYRMCARAGFENQAECARQEQLLSGWLRELERPLEDNPSLTATGRGLFEPLHERL